jgi:hypothetical protein
VKTTDQVFIKRLYESQPTDALKRYVSIFRVLKGFSQTGAVMSDPFYGSDFLVGVVNFFVTIIILSELSRGVRFRRFLRAFKDPSSKHARALWAARRNSYFGQVIRVETMEASHRLLSFYFIRK